MVNLRFTLYCRNVHVCLAVSVLSNVFVVCLYYGCCVCAAGLGPVFGNRDYFSGLGVFLDTYANQNGQHNVSSSLY